MQLDIFSYLNLLVIQDKREMLNPLPWKNLQLAFRYETGMFLLLG